MTARKQIDAAKDKYIASGDVFTSDAFHAYVTTVCSLLPSLFAEHDARVKVLEEALRFYANKEHFDKLNEDAWDTGSGETQNYWYDDEGTAVVEDGAIARTALNQTPKD